MDILQKIFRHKEGEVAALQTAERKREISQLPFFERTTRSLAKALRKSPTGVIAEIKRASPSEGTILDPLQPAEVAAGYASAGAAAISVLTDEQFFKGSAADLTEARRAVEIPLLRKDFIIDEIQIEQARGIGADAILLIAACLSPARTKQLATAARQFGLEVLLEVHNLEELQSHFSEDIDLLGVNNRNLRDFSISLRTSEELISSIPDSVARISESGLRRPEDAMRLKQLGFDGLLIGTSFVKSGQPAKACREFVDQMKAIKQLKPAKHE